MSEKVSLDDNAVAIVKKWSGRIGTGWEPSASDVIRHLDVLAEQAARGDSARVRSRS
ncbi:MAG: hypothetical protein ACYDCK_01410 [Thermoplasmatota archaeon]